MTIADDIMAGKEAPAVPGEAPKSIADQIMAAPGPDYSKMGMRGVELASNQEMRTNEAEADRARASAQPTLHPDTDTSNPAKEWWNDFGVRSNEYLGMISDGFVRLFGDSTVAGRAGGALEMAGGAVGAVWSPAESAAHVGVSKPLEAAGKAASTALGGPKDFSPFPAETTTSIVTALAPFAGEAAPVKEATRLVDKTIAKVYGTPFVESLRSTVNPAYMDPASEATKETIRATNGVYYHRMDMAQQKLEQFRMMFGRLDKESSYAFMHAMDTGAAQATPELDKAAESMKVLMDEPKAEIEKVDGDVTNWLSNYFPHIWKDPQAAKDRVAQMLNRRTLMGTKSFKKQRSILTIEDGLAAGLEPVSDNPIDMVLLKYGEMQKYLVGKRVMESLRNQGILQWVPFKDMKSGRLPPGYAKLDDYSFKPYRQITATYREAFDKVFRDRILGLAEKLGMSHDRALDIRKSRIGKMVQGTPNALTPSTWGVAMREKPIMSTQFGGTDFVIAHEFGHLLDFRYSLADKLHRDPKAWKELGDLAMRRGPNASPEFKAYLLNERERIANLVHAYLYAPDLLNAVAPTARAHLEQIIRLHPELREMEQIRPGVELGTDEITEFLGPTPAGEYVAPEHAARVINNNFGAISGLRASPLTKGVMTLGNNMNMMQLGLSMYHFTFVTLDAMNSETARALESLSHGEFKRGAWGLAKSATIVGPAISAVRKGHALRKEWLTAAGMSPELQNMVRGMEAAGGRFGYSDMHRMSEMGRFRMSLDRNDFTRQIRETFQKSGDTQMQRIFKGPFSLIARTMETAAAPLMEAYVPRVKAGVFMDMAQDFMRRTPDAKPSEMAKEFQSIWDSVDNRMGLMNYDNLMWSQTTRIAAHMAFRSVGWNLGTIREVGGSGVDAARQIRTFFEGNNPHLTHKMAYTSSLLFNTALMGSMMNYMYTGEMPKDAMDAFYPRTGRGDERIVIPTYVKDLNQYNIDPVGTLSGKLNPFWASAGEFFSNRDFYGAAIVDKSSPPATQVADYMKYLANEFVPFSMRMDISKRRVLQVPGGEALRAFGIQRAPMQIADPEKSKRFERARERAAVRKKHKLEAEAERGAGE